jgi:hypothetical protein
VVNHKNAANDETPLQAAHRRRDGPVGGALLGHGADARALGRNAHPLAIRIAYGQADSLRVLLNSGKHSADERLAYWVGAPIDPWTRGAAVSSCRPAHLFVVPPRLSPGNDPPPPQLECLDVLEREFGADVNKPDEPERRTPLQSHYSAHRSHERRAFDALVALGAGLDVPDLWGKTFIFHVRERERLQQVLARGAWPNLIAPDGNTPLINACLQQNEAIVSALLPLTSTKTRRSVLASSGYSALDWELYMRDPPRRLGIDRQSKSCSRLACPSSLTRRPACSRSPRASPRASRPKRPSKRVGTTPRPGRGTRRWWGWPLTFRR